MNSEDAIESMLFYESSRSETSSHDIIYITDDEFLKINSDRTFQAALRDVLN